MQNQLADIVKQQAGHVRHVMHADPKAAVQEAGKTLTQFGYLLGILGMWAS